jgi:hypothetical protein
MQQRMVWQKSSYLSLLEDYIAFLVEQWDLQQLFQLGVMAVEEGVVVEKQETDLNLFDQS